MPKEGWVILFVLSVIRIKHVRIKTIVHCHQTKVKNYEALFSGLSFSKDPEISCYSGEK